MVAALGDDSKALLYGPAEQNLRRGFMFPVSPISNVVYSYVKILTTAVRLGDGSDGFVSQETRGFRVHAELEPTLRAEGRVSGDGDTEGLGESYEAFLSEVGVELNL